MFVNKSDIRKRPHAMNFIKKLTKQISYKLSEVNKIKILTVDNFLLACNVNGLFIDDMRRKIV